MKKYPEQKTILCCLEGSDAIDFNTLKNNLEKHYKSDISYYVFNYEYPSEHPTFRKTPKEYIAWLNALYIDITDKLLKLSKKYDVIIFDKLLITDLVYSTLFKRPITAEKYVNKLRLKFTIINHIFIYNSFNDYHIKCLKLDVELYYEKSEYDKITSLFLKYGKMTFNNYGDIYRVSKIKYFTGSKNIYLDFIKYMESINMTLFNRNL